MTALTLVGQTFIQIILKILSDTASRTASEEKVNPLLTSPGQ
jgi:hypothetical protein